MGRYRWLPRLNRYLPCCIVQQLTNDNISISSFLSFFRSFLVMVVMVAVAG